ncbi:MAG: VOC family protein [Bifidobacteriaceae bacterium]|jgi:catechol 2,3-dioxygenase-like lactoylglutathione lyase family enzyme|nr:VOC family protein [Bifidobacteriaceae bacterium]
MSIRIRVTSIFVDDQAKALAFYTGTLGFMLKADQPLGEFRWLTVVGPDEPDGTELLLEPNQHPAARAYQEALVADGIPAAQFEVDDVEAACRDLSARGVRLTQPPLAMGPVMTAVLDDTCGNLVQLVSPVVPLRGNPIAESVPTSQDEVELGFWPGNVSEEATYPVDADDLTAWGLE